jgi:hypothetical protein
MTVRRLAFVVVLCGAIVGRAADAGAFKKAAFSHLVEQESVGNVAAGVGVLVYGRFREPDGPSAQLRNTVVFKAGLTGLTVSTSWVVLTATAPFRIVGVNVDLLDASDTVVKTDTFEGTLAGVAHSTLTIDGLTPGAIYRLVFTGTLVSAGSYTMTIETR